MKTCSTPGCDKPHHAKGLCNTCYQAQKIRDRIRDKSVTESVTSVTQVVPESGGCVEHVSRSEVISEHNASFYFLINSDVYCFDTEVDWKQIRSRGRFIGKYTHRHIRDALGFHYEKSMKGKKPPVSVVKGQHTNKVEVSINDAAGITSEAQLDDLLARIKAILETDLDARLQGPYPVTWKKGSEKGQPVRDFNIPCPVAKLIGQKHPEEIPLQATRRPEDPHDNAKVDGSHPTAWEVNSRKQAENQKALVEKALKVSKSANDIELTREGVDTLKKLTEELARMAGLKRAGYIRDSALESVYRKIKEKGEVHSLGLTNLIVNTGATRREVEGLREEQAITGENLGKVAAILGEFGENVKSHLELVDAVNNAAEAFKEAAEPRPRYKYLYRRRGR